MKRFEGLLVPGLMKDFPSRTVAGSFGDWVANHVSLEQLLGVAGWLSPEFVEIQGHVFWDCESARILGRDRVLSTPFGDDPVTVERYGNIVNLVEFFFAIS